MSSSEGRCDASQGYTATECEAAPAGLWPFIHCCHPLRSTSGEYVPKREVVSVITEILSMPLLNQLCTAGTAGEPMNLNPVLRQMISKSRRAYFDVFVHIYCRARAKQPSTVHWEASIGFKLFSK